MISWGFMSALSIYDRKETNEDELMTAQYRNISNILYAFQFFTQWTSLLLFVMQYRQTEVEIRKVLG